MKLNFIIETIIRKGDPNKDYNVITKLEFDDSERNSKEHIKEGIMKQYRELFEIESISAIVVDKDLTTEIRISTRNTEKIEMIRKNMASAVRKQTLTLPPINLN